MFINQQKERYSYITVSTNLEKAFDTIQYPLMILFKQWENSDSKMYQKIKKDIYNKIITNIINNKNLKPSFGDQSLL